MLDRYQLKTILSKRVFLKPLFLGANSSPIAPAKGMEIRVCPCLERGARQARRVAPIAPTACIQSRTAQASHFHRQHIWDGADATAAVVHHALGVSPIQQGFKLGFQNCWAFHEALWREVAGKRSVQRPRNVTRHRIERFGLPFESSRGSRIHNGLCGLAQSCGHIGCEFERDQAVSQWKR